MVDAGEFSASAGAPAQLLDSEGEQRVKAALRAERLLGFPTETVWGLGVTAHSAGAVGRLARCKGRPAGKPFQLLCADTEEALSLVAPAALDRARWLARCWPGPLTLVVPAAPGCPDWLAAQGRVGLRVPDHPISRRLAELAGGFLVGSSLNLSGGEPARTLAEAQASGLAELLIAGEAGGGPPSTVFDAVAGRVLRQGGVPEARLMELWSCAG